MKNGILAFWHCRRCLEENPGVESPRDFARFECGWTKAGFQVWCVRHDCNVTAIDLQGQKVKIENS